jgi:hypothetical protein
MKKQFKSSLLKAVFLLSLTALLASAAGPAFASQSAGVEEIVLQAIAPNDDFDSASNAASIPYRVTRNDFEATESGDDPTATQCNLTPGLATVWYKFSPSANILVHMDTLGSNYDTYMAVWTGTRGHLTHVACNDDASSATFTSAVNITLQGGTTYYIQVAQFNGNTADASQKSVSGAGVEAGTTHKFRLFRLYSKTYYSNGTHDGYVTESSENSNVGQAKNSTLTNIRLGDDSQRRQIVGIVSFNTAAIPDNGVVVSALIKIKRSAISANTIFTTLSGLKVDIRKPFFGASLGLAANDFQAAASRKTVGTFNPAIAAGWYSAKLLETSYALVNKTGYTQYRIRFAKGDDNDSASDFLRFYSGNAAQASKPILVIQYYVP